MTILTLGIGLAKNGFAVRRQRGR